MQFSSPALRDSARERNGTSTTRSAGCRRYDEESDLYYFRNRYYDPQHGRFLSRDPMGYQDSYCLYQFVNNNPVCYVDPMGLQYDIPDPFWPSSGAKFFRELMEMVFGPTAREAERTVQETKYKAEGFAASTALYAMATCAGWAGYDYASDLLLHALGKSGSPVSYDKNSNIAKDIAANGNFRRAIEFATAKKLDLDKLSNQSVGATVNYVVSGETWAILDRPERLRVAINKAKIEFRSTVDVKKTREGTKVKTTRDGRQYLDQDFSITGKVDATVKDKYDFAPGGKSELASLGYQAQSEGYLVPFDITVKVEMDLSFEYYGIKNVPKDE